MDDADVCDAGQPFASDTVFVNFLVAEPNMSESRDDEGFAMILDRKTEKVQFKSHRAQEA